MIGTNQEAQVLYDALTFRQLLDSLARPGKINQLEYPRFYGEAPTYFSQASQGDMPMNMYALGALLVLLDRETSFIMAADGEWLARTAPVVHWTMLRSDASFVAADQAAFALFCNSGNNGLLPQLSMGTLLEPELSTTVIYAVERLALSEDVDGRQEGGMTLELRGPGIQEQRSIYVEGLAEADMTAIFATRQSYPSGIDVYFIDVDGHCIGLPRTTRIVVQ